VPLVPEAEVPPLDVPVPVPPPKLEAELEPWPLLAPAPLEALVVLVWPHAPAVHPVVAVVLDEPELPLPPGLGEHAASASPTPKTKPFCMCPPRLLWA
jgi:hypothetical protein